MRSTARHVAVFIVLSSLLGCSESGSTCEVDRVVTQFVAGASVSDCGTLPFVDGLHPMDLTPWMNARACTLAAISSQTPFVVQYQDLTIEGADGLALVGLVTNSGWNVSWFDRDVGITGHAHSTERFACSSLRDLGDCDDLADTLCFVCDGASVVATCTDP